MHIYLRCSYRHYLLDGGEHCLLLFLDLNQTFDSVIYRILPNDLEYIGNKEKALKNFERYLVGRLQRIRVGTATSEMLTNDYGVPQGTIRGPVLIDIYLNEFVSGKMPK